MGIIGNVAARVRQPAYTGENRCVPCTILNLLIAVSIAGVLVRVGRLWIGGTTFVTCVGIIYFRGYLVPKTPTLTERYVPDHVLRLFGKDLSFDHSLDGRETVDDEHELVELLAATGVLTRDQANELDLTPSFRDRWRERITLVRERDPGIADVRAMYNADSTTRYGPTSFVINANKSVRWDSEAAFHADVAVAIELSEWYDVWETLTELERDRVGTGLRLFLRHCPACDGSLSVVENRIDPCCQKAQTIVQSICSDCGEMIADAAIVDTGDTTNETSIRTQFLST